MIRTVLADDEALARQKLRQLLQEIKDVEIVGECASAFETIELVRLTNPELLFLDIRLSDMSGFDVAESIFSGSEKRALPHLIFVTANDKYAVRAFEKGAIDYLLKPYTSSRLREGVQRVRERLNRSISGSKDAKDSEQSDHPSRIIFKSRGRILFLQISDIRSIKAGQNYARVCTGTETHSLRETIKSLEQRLDRKVFLRVHRSAIVNLQHVKEIKNEANGDATVLLDNGDCVPLSRSYRWRIQKLLKS